MKLSASDADGTVSRVEVRVDGGSWYPLAAPYNTIDTSLDNVYYWPRTLGDHLLEVKATDSAGATSTVSVPFKLGNAFEGDVFRLDMFDNALVGTAIPLRTNGLIGGYGGTLPTSVTYYVNGSAIGSATQAPFLYLWQPVSAGSYSVSLRATASDGTIYVSNPGTISVRSAPVVSIPNTSALPSTTTISGTVRAPAGSTISVAGQPTYYDPVSGRFFTGNVSIPTGAVNIDVEIVTPDGQRFTQRIAATGSGAPRIFAVDTSPIQGDAPFEAALFVRRLSSGLASPQVRITCDVETQPEVTQLYPNTDTLDWTKLGSCYIASPGVRTIQFEFLDAQNNVIETHKRQALARAPATAASAMLTTYYSFLSLLLDNKLVQAVQFGILEGNRDSVQSQLSSVSVAQLKNYAANMFDVREIRVYGHFAEVVIALPIAGGNVDFYVVRLNVDAEGFWRIESL